MAKSKAQCLADCYETYNRERGSIGEFKALENYNLCKDRCEESKEPPPEMTGSPCKVSGGYKGKQARDARGEWKLISPCKEGFKPKRDSQGQIWCCPKAETVPGGENGEEAGDDEIGPECYKLEDDPISPGGGKIWTDQYITPDMGFFRDPQAEGHWVHKDGRWYVIGDVHDAIKAGTLTDLQGKEGYACRKNYERRVKDGVVYCCPSAAGAAPGAGAGGGEGGEFQWSPELLDAIRSMLSRYEEILDRPLGLTDEERQEIVNYALQGIRKGERGRIQSTVDRLARMGMAGQPIELSEIAKIQRGTREAEADIRSRLAIDEIDRRMRDFLTTSQTASDILSQLLQTEQLPEILSAGRRREGLDWASLLTNYLGSQFGAGNPYWQMLFSYMNQGQRGGDIWDILPYLGYYVGSRYEKDPLLDYPNPWD